MRLQASTAQLEVIAAELADGGPRAVQPPFHLTRSVQRVRSLFNSNPVTRVSTDSVDRAIRLLASAGVGELRPRQRFVLANALAQSPPVLNGESVLECRFTDGLLSSWEEDAHARRMRALHWRGLFHSYLQAAPSERLSRLRELLRRSLPALIERTTTRPGWMDTALSHRALLSSNPCADYAAELIDGKKVLLDDLTEAINVPAGSWFWRTLAETFCKHLAGLSDSAFYGRIEFSLTLAQGLFKHSRDKVLAAVLDRLSESGNRPRHNGLLEYSLSVWRSPQLAASVSWAQVRLDAKQMVCAWLAEQDLRDFYELCQGDQQVDEERLEYWLRFKYQISFSQIILGTSLRESSARDARDFRRRHEGRLAFLTGTTSSNNAMLMQIGNWLFVEFSEKGNACYGYKVDRLPFKTGAQSYAIGDLRNPQTIDRLKGCRLIHRGAWQFDIFDPALQERGIRPDLEEIIGARAKPCIPAAIAAIIPSRLLGDIHRIGGNVSDSRPDGGLLIVRLPVANSSIDSELRRIGFSWSRDTGYWFE